MVKVQSSHSLQTVPLPFVSWRRLRVGNTNLDTANSPISSADCDRARSRSCYTYSTWTAEALTIFAHTRAPAFLSSWNGQNWTGQTEYILSIQIHVFSLGHAVRRAHRFFLKFDILFYAQGTCSFDICASVVAMGGGKSMKKHLTKSFCNTE